MYRSQSASSSPTPRSTSRVMMTRLIGPDLRRDDFFGCELRRPAKDAIDRGLIRTRDIFPYVRGPIMHHGVSPYQLGRHSRRSSRHCCPAPDCPPHCCCAPHGCCDLALSELGKLALPPRAGLASVLRATLASFFRFAPSSRSRLACASCDIRRYSVSIILPFRSTRKHSENALARLLCVSPDSRPTDLHASCRLASGDGGASTTFGAA